MLSNAVLLLFCCTAFASTTTNYRICVRHSELNHCQEMMRQGKGVGVVVSCVPGRDTMDCIYKIQNHQADFMPAQPVDIYAAGKLSNSDFSVFNEIRVVGEHAAPHQSEVVAVVPNHLQVTRVEEIQNYRMCFPTRGDFVYNTVLRHFYKRLVGHMNSSYTAVENEMKGFERIFGKSCLPGRWSAYQKLNDRIRRKYSRLHSICDNPVTSASQEDAYFGPEGALRCLTDGCGQVAFTYSKDVRQYFADTHGTHSGGSVENNSSEYSYFCPDGTKMPVTGRPCGWASVNWPGYMGRSSIDHHGYKTLNDALTKLYDVGIMTRAVWLPTVLQMNNHTVLKSVHPRTPMKYIDASYVETMDNQVTGQPPVRICVVGQVEMSKCEVWSATALSRGIHPALHCVLRMTPEDCGQAVSSHQADFTVMEPLAVYRMPSNDHLRSVAHEEYHGVAGQNVLAVVRQGSVVKRFEDLVGKTVCLMNGDEKMYIGITSYILKRNFTGMSCHHVALTHFFSKAHYSDDPVECVMKGGGDVAFVPEQLYEAAHSGLDYLCENNGNRSFHTCSLAVYPLRMVMMSNESTSVQQDEVLHVISESAQIFGADSQYFQLFGDFNPGSGVIFSKFADGVAANESDDVRQQDSFKNATYEYNVKCNA